MGGYISLIQDFGGLIMLAFVPSQRRPTATASSAFVPSPTGGWDDSQPISSSDPSKAHILDNWFPQPEYVELRRGFGEHSDTGQTTPVQSLMQYHGPSGVEKLFGACNGSIFDVSASSGSSSVTGLGNNKFQHVNFTTSGGSFLYCVNGEDAPQYFNGSTWAEPVITGSGITPENFINVSAHKGRLYFIPVNSTKFVYLPTDSIQGAAQTFELGGVMTLGGYLVAHGTLTIDGGSGPDDHAVFITSKGQAIVYQGNDPADANQWSLVGVYDVPPPIGRRCLQKIAGDLGILTIAGVLPLSKAMVVDKAAVDNIALTTNIDTTMTSAAREYAANFGWQIVTYPRNNMFIVNIPLQESGETHQYVMNTRNGAWCRFKGQDAVCWSVFQDKLYFGGLDGKVYAADSAATDNGQPILADMATAYSFFGSRGQLKQFKLIRPHIISDGRVGSAIKLHAEWGSHLSDTPPNNYVGQTLLASARWDDGRTWDSGTFWPEERIVSQNWRAISAVGRSASIRMRVLIDSAGITPVAMQVSGFDVTFDKGGMI